MPMYNLIEHSNNHSNISGSLWQVRRDEIENKANFTVASSSSFKYKSDFVDDAEVDGTKSRVKIALRLKYLINFWRSFEISLINSKVDQIKVEQISSSNQLSEGFKKSVYWNG